MCFFKIESNISTTGAVNVCKHSQFLRDPHYYGNEITISLVLLISGGGANSQRANISKNLYVKTKESGPLGGVRRTRPL